MVFVFFLFFANFAMLFGPLLLMNLSQMQSFEPGDAEWGVNLEDVRGQVEAKGEVSRVVDIWQSGEQFERAGGKRERGLLLFGAPGTGKTMLAKAIATGFNSPFISMPGSGFAATFIGIDAIIVRILARKAKRLARKWGGQCIVFIDEIDAVGMRRQSLGTRRAGLPPRHELGRLRGSASFRPVGRAESVRRPDRRDAAPGATGSSRSGRPRPGHRAASTRAWRRSPTGSCSPGAWAAAMGGGLALNQLLVVMDGIDNPPFFRRHTTSTVNKTLDALFIVPRRIGKKRLRMPAARPRSEQIYFIGATNVPIDRLDPALIRPGRMGRHVWFRTPTKDDRLDILDLYIGKVSHEPDLDSPKRRDEIARIMSGYSPAMIEQAISMALTMAHHDGRVAFGWDDLVEALTTLDAGTAVGSEHVGIERRSVAIHEAGHAVAGHLYVKGAESARLTIKKRGETGGHHWMIQKEDRMFAFQHEMFADVVHTLGAMAAERVFYGENTSGVGGDVAERHVADGPDGRRRSDGPAAVHRDAEGGPDRGAGARRGPPPLRADRAPDHEPSGGGGPFDPDPISGVLGDPSKRTVAAQILGQAYVTAHNVAKTNRAGIDRIADALEARLEIMGDELIELLDTSGLTIPEFDLADEASWPPAEFSAAVGRGDPQASAPARNRGEDVSDATVPNEKPLGFIDAEPAQPVGPSNESSNDARTRTPSRRVPTGPATRPTTHDSSRVYIALALVAGVGVGALVASIMRDDTDRGEGHRRTVHALEGRGAGRGRARQERRAEVPARRTAQELAAVIAEPQHAAGRPGGVLPRSLPARGAVRRHR